MQPINKRPFRTFLSHAHADKGFVDRLYRWATETVGLRVWYDSTHFPSGLVASELGKAIENCQSAIIVLTSTAVASGWVEEEWNICIEQKHVFPDFQIVLLNLDGCTPPAPLRVRKWINSSQNDLDPFVATQLLEALHWHQTLPAGIGQSTFYLARGSRLNEVDASEQHLSRLRGDGIRFIRDSPDQSSFSESRIKHIMYGTSGLFAFLPERGKGQTSNYILNEIRFAKEVRLPVFAVVDNSLPLSLVTPLCEEGDVIMSANSDPVEVDWRVQNFVEASRPPLRNMHCFFGHSLQQADRDLWAAVKRVAEAVSGLPCISGDDLIGDNAQDIIVKSIGSSAVAVFDISDDRLNTCIEAGIARGANARYELICREPRRSPPFMFRDKQVFFYATPAELIGLTRKIVFDLRRVVC